MQNNSNVWCSIYVSFPPPPQPNGSNIGARKRANGVLLRMTFLLYNEKLFSLSGISIFHPWSTYSDFPF